MLSIADQPAEIRRLYFALIGSGAEHAAAGLAKDLTAALQLAGETPAGRCSLVLLFGQNANRVMLRLEKQKMPVEDFRPFLCRPLPDAEGNERYAPAADDDDVLLRITLPAAHFAALAELCPHHGRLDAEKFAARFAEKVLIEAINQRRRAGDFLRKRP